MTFIPAGNISRKARLDRDMIPSFACLYRARGVGALPDTKSTGERSMICHVYGLSPGPLKVQGLSRLSGSSEFTPETITISVGLSPSSNLNRLPSTSPTTQDTRPLLKSRGWFSKRLIVVVCPSTVLTWYMTIPSGVMRRVCVGSLCRRQSSMRLVDKKSARHCLVL